MMHFALTEEQELLRRTVREFAEKELTPEYLRELDATGRAPGPLLRFACRPSACFEPLFCKASSLEIP